MKKIVPFNNVLTFSTDVCEITAISLEHDIKTDDDSISGVFFISGEYKITDGQLEKEKFNFELPFDIALGADYDVNTLVVDIDDFRYELLDRNKLKVNIELFIDGEEKEIVTDEGKIDNLILEEKNEEVIEEPVDIDIKEIEENDIDDDREITYEDEDDSDLLHEMLDDKDVESVKDVEIENNNENNNENNSTNNIFNGFTDEEKYVTYRVYRVVDGDNIDKIMERYNVTKEELEKYNNTLDIHSGDKLIIPYNDK